MGGMPPLGYDVENRRLVPNPQESKLVRQIFQRFVELGSSTKLVRELKLDAGASGLPRLPAAELESAVLEQLRGLLRSPALIADVVPKATALDPSLDEAKVTVGLTRLDAIWDELFPVEQHRLVSLLVEKVVVSPNELELRLRTNGIERVLLELNTQRSEDKVAA